MFKTMIFTGHPDNKLVPSSPMPKTINPKNMTQNDRAALWSGIQKTNKALATMLTTDPALKKLINTFDGQIIFERDEAERYINQGLNN